MVEACLKLLELGYFEVKCAFEGLADENVWKRPAPGLLSVGELAGHHAFWEAVRLAGDGTIEVLREAIQFHIEGMRLNGEVVPEPTTDSERVLITA